VDSRTFEPHRTANHDVVGVSSAALPSHAERLDFYNESLQKIARTVMILQYAGPEGYNSQLAILSKRNLNVKSH
jgi:hypothetical protein